jgi:hypothetical protein
MKNYIGTPISGATGATYDATADDVGQYLFCDVTATNTAGSTTQSSNLVGPIAAPTTTFDPANKNAAVTLSNGNKTASVVDTGGGYKTVYGTISRNSGKRYFEFALTDVSNLLAVGVAEAGGDLSSRPGAMGNSFGLNGNGSGLTFDGDFTVFGSFDVTCSDGDVVGVAIDFGAGKIWFSQNGVYVTTSGQDPTAGVNAEGLFPTPLDLFPVLALYSLATASATIATKSADFAHAPPTGFVGWDN